jgi:hypothetical protein
VPVKIVVAGGFGVGKTTVLGAISEKSPLTTEAEMTTESVGIADTTRIDACYPAVDYFERAGLPFVVALNTCNGQLGYHIDNVRWALAVRDDVPVLSFDARFVFGPRHPADRATQGPRSSHHDEVVVKLRRSLQVRGSHPAFKRAEWTGRRA